jgi:hypothetical protein
VAEQMTFPDRVMLPAARARADVGIAQAADATERHDTGWCMGACERLRLFAKVQSGMFTIELARLAFEKTLPAPNDLRSWGAVTRMATSRGFIERVKGQYFPAASSNGSEKPVYRAGANA